MSLIEDKLHKLCMWHFNPLYNTVIYVLYEKNVLYSTPHTCLYDTNDNDTEEIDQMWVVGEGI